MKPRAGYLALGLSAALAIAGVVLEGTEQNPWNLVMAFFLPIATLEALMARQTLATHALGAVVSGLAIYGGVWTLGTLHAVSPRAALVYIGLVGAVLSSVLLPVRAKRPGTGPGA